MELVAIGGGVFGVIVVICVVIALIGNAGGSEKAKIKRAMENVLADYPQYTEAAIKFPDFARRMMQELGWKEISFKYYLND